MKTTLLSMAGLLAFTAAFCQVGIGTANVNPDALLELNSTSGNTGLLLDTVALTAVVSPDPFPAHVSGMVVYNSATSASDPERIYPGMYFNDGSRWVRMSIDKESPKVGDLKQSTLLADHDGWYAMDGRALSALPVPAQANASTVGISVNLPNAADAILKGKRTNETFGSTGGATSFEIDQENLPNINYTGTTSAAGAHTHTYVNRGNTYWNYTAGGVGGFRFVNGETRTTASSGAHTHTLTVPSGGSGTPINFRPKYISVQTFIYLGS